MPGYHEKEWNEYLETFRQLQSALDKLQEEIKRIAKDVEPPDPPFNEISGVDHLRNIMREARKVK